MPNPGTWRRITVANAEYQVLSALPTNRKLRNREGVFLVEGVRNINGAVAAGWDVDAVVTHIDARTRLSAWASDVVARAGATRALELGGDLFDALTERADRPELLLVVRKRATVLGELAAGPEFLGVVIDRPGSPGNLGTIIRTADAMGADAVVVSGHGADLYDPRCVRATAGSFFAVATAEVSGPTELARWRDGLGAGVTVVVADEGGDGVLGELPISRPVVVVLGNETSGPSNAYLELADRVVAIPTYGSASSLNVAEANAMVLYEIDRQRRLSRRSPP